MNRKFSWTASVTALYVILILAVHPIIYQDYYFNILNVKYLFYCACTIGMLILLGGYFIFTGAFKRIKLKLIPTDYAFLAFIVIETLHTQISSLFLGKDGTALAYQVSEGYMRWLGYFFIFMGIKMATDGVLRGLGIMRPFLVANMVNLAIRLSVALICAPRFGIAFVWLAVPAGWLANFLISYGALRKSWPTDKMVSTR